MSEFFYMYLNMVRLKMKKQVKKIVSIGYAKHSIVTTTHSAKSYEIIS